MMRLGLQWPKPGRRSVQVAPNISVANSSKFQDDGLQANERNLSDDLAMEKARKDRKDIILNEAARILSDEISMLNSNASL